jgi:hypothetical protein
MFLPPMPVIAEYAGQLPEKIRKLSSIITVGYVIRIRDVTVNASNEASPTPEALREQLKELNNRSRWYSGQLWYIPFAYFGLVALTVGNVGFKEPKFIGLSLLYCGIIGVFVFWHMISIRDGEKNYPLAFLVGVCFVFVTCLLGGGIILCRSLCCLPN